MMIQAVGHATKIIGIFTPLDEDGDHYAVTADRVIPFSELSAAERRRLQPYLRANERGWWPRVVR